MTRPPKPAVAVVGCGHWGQNLVRNFSEMGCLAAISDLASSTATRTSDRYRVPARPFDDLLGDPGIHAIAIAAPAEAHAALGRRALAADKHVFVEKPLALDAAQAEELCAAAEGAGLTLMVGHLLRYHSAFLRLQQLVREGAVGRLQYLYSNRLNFGRIRREEDILWSFAPHDISMILAIVGSEPETVSAMGSNYLHKTIADVTTTHLAFPGGERGHVFVSWLHPYKEQRLVVVGDAGMMVFDDAEPWASKLTFYEHRVDPGEGVPTAVKAAAVAVPVEEVEPLAAECRHFVDCVTTGRVPTTDGREGLRVLRVLQRASDSLGTAQPPPGPERPDRAGNAGSDGYFVHPSSFVDEGVSVGADTKVWHFCHLLGDTRIGARCSLGQNVVVGPRVTIGDDCRIQNNVSIYEGVTLEDGVFCGPSCVFTNVVNPRAEISRREDFRPTYVRRGATIGANATIVCGHEIGEHAFIAAGAVVTRDVPAHALMAGIPARRIGWVSHDGETLGDDLVCPRSGRKYVETGPEELREVEDQTWS